MPAQKTPVRSVLTALLGIVSFSALTGLLATLMVAPAIAVTGVTASSTVGIFNDLPDYIELDTGAEQNTLVVRTPGVSDPEDPEYYTQIATIYSQNREVVELDEISEYLQCAAIAGEDRRFYEHGGVDVPSLMRAVLGQVTGTSDSGASTLSMQTVRNILQQQALNDPDLTPEQKQEAIEAALYYSLDRKIREMKLAIGLEKNYTKDEILAGYLNIAGFGGNTYGVEAAAYEFFSATAADVTIAQAASLLAIVQNPSTRSLNNPENYAGNQARRDVILQNMYDYGCITATERDEALATPVDENFVIPSDAKVGCLNAAKYMKFACDYATRDVVLESLDALGSTPEERMQNWDRGGYTLVLSVNPTLQKTATQTVQEWAPKNENRFELGSAVASVQVGTGRILVMTQNKDYDNTPEGIDDSTSTAINLATDVLHGGSKGFQPGSTYKALVLLAFLDAGHGVNEAFNAGLLEVNQASFADSCDASESGPPWGGTFKFKNDAGETGSYTVMRAAANSVNSVFLQMAAQLDQCAIKNIAASIGVHRADGAQDGSLPFDQGGLQSRPSCAIGGCENNLDPLTEAAAYAAISNLGVYCAPRMVDDVLDADGVSVVGYGEKESCGQSLVAPNVAATAIHALKGVMTSGTATASNPNDGTPYFAKTGTTNDAEHVWITGSSSRVATSVWVGNIVGDQSLRQITVSGTQAALLRHRIFRPIALAIDSRYPGEDWPGPDPTLLTGNPVEVPDVVGLTPEQAKSIIEVAELVYKSGGEVDSDLPAGQVARTDPGAGAEVPRGTTVTVYRSNGLAKPVPNVVGMQVGAATGQLNSEGFSSVDQVCVDATDYPDTLPGDLPGNNEVTAQNPGGGASRNPANTTVTLTVFSTVPCPA